MSKPSPGPPENGDYPPAEQVGPESSGPAFDASPFPTAPDLRVPPRARDPQSPQAQQRGQSSWAGRPTMTMPAIPGHTDPGAGEPAPPDVLDLHAQASRPPSTEAIPATQAIDFGEDWQSALPDPTWQASEPRSLLTKTDVEGLDPVRLGRGSAGYRIPGQNRQPLTRVLPLVLVVTIGVFAIAFGGFGMLSQIGSTPSSDEEPLSQTVTLPAGAHLVGLSEDNKESVLQACFRISENPNRECRRDYLRDIGEYPHRMIDFPSFQMDRYETTNGQFEACVAAGICSQRQLDDCQFHIHRGYQLGAAVPERMLVDEVPAICVTREEAQTFCRWAGGYLPTPDEWERAARGGNDRLAPWGNVWAPDMVNWAETDMGGFAVAGRLDGFELTAPVDRFSEGRSADGIYNMLGNVAEWVAQVDRFEDGTRGGSYRDDLRDLRVTYQRPLRPDVRRSDVGFRCAYPVIAE